MAGQRIKDRGFSPTNFRALIKTREDIVAESTLSFIVTMPDFSAKNAPNSISAPDPTEKTYNAPPDPLAGEKGNFGPQCSALRASILVLFRAKLPGAPKNICPYAYAHI